MRLFSASIRLCLLYFLVTADKGQGNNDHLFSSSLSSSPSSVIQEKAEATTDGRSPMEEERVNAIQETTTTSKEEGADSQRVSALAIRSVMVERDQLKQNLQDSELEAVKLKREELSSQPGQSHRHRPRRHRRRSHEEISPRVPRSISSSNCVTNEDFLESLRTFRNRNKILMQGMVELQHHQQESISDMGGDIMFLQSQVSEIIHTHNTTQETLNQLGENISTIHMTQEIPKEQCNGVMGVISDILDDVKGLTRAVNDLQVDVIVPRELPRRDCYNLFQAGVKRSGVYTIYPQQDGSEGGVRVWCDMGDGEGGEEEETEETEEGGGWTVILQRRSLPHPVNFTRGWEEYKKGFGEAETEYWIGNEVLHQLTSSSEGKPQQALHVEMTDWDNVTRVAFYGRFAVGSEEDKFPLEVTFFYTNRSSVLGDSLDYHNGMKFSTIDQDNDERGSGNCALSYGGGGFWYKSCRNALPTAPILPKGESGHGLYWYHFNNDGTKLKSLKMKIKPSG